MYIFWRKGVDGKFFDLADYPTKHHPTSHHRAMRPTYVLNNIQEIFSDPTTPSHVPLHHQQQHFKSVTKPHHVALHLQRNLHPPPSTHNTVLPTPQRKFSNKHPSKFAIQNLRDNLVLPCKGVLEPIPANPSRIGTRISPRIPANTRPTKWHNHTTDTQRQSCPSKSVNESGATSACKSIGCKPYIYPKACSHSLSKAIYNLQLA